MIIDELLLDLSVHAVRIPPDVKNKRGGITYKFDDPDRNNLNLDSRCSCSRFCRGGHRMSYIVIDSDRTMKRVNIEAGNLNLYGKVAKVTLHF